jgi:flagellar protein FliO/FliZ
MRKLWLSAIAFLALTGSLRAQDKDKVIYPRSAALADAPVSSPSGGFNSGLLVLALGAAAAGGWLLWRQRRGTSGLAGREARKLAIAESRSLGNRQYLVVADYEGKKFLIGVCPGRIDLLSPLDGSSQP